MMVFNEPYSGYRFLLVVNPSVPGSEAHDGPTPLPTSLDLLRYVYDNYKTHREIRVVALKDDATVFHVVDGTLMFPLPPPLTEPVRLDDMPSFFETLGVPAP